MNQEYIEYISENKVNPLNVWLAQDLYIKGKSIEKILSETGLTNDNVEFLKSSLNWDRLKDSGQLQVQEINNFDFTKQFVLDLIDQSCPVYSAFSAIGLDRQQADELLQKDVEFYIQVNKLVAEKIVEILRNIKTLGDEKSDWKAWAWLLEKHEDFRGRFKEDTGNKNPVLQVELSFNRVDSNSKNIIDVEFNRLEGDQI